MYQVLINDVMPVTFFTINEALEFAWNSQRDDEGLDIKIVANGQIFPLDGCPTHEEYEP